MTCIVGMVHNGIVYIGGDSASSCGYEIRASTLHKVFRTGPFIIGYTSSFRMGQILQHHLVVNPQVTISDEKYMVTVFADAVRRCVRDNGWSVIRDNHETGGQFLVGYRGRLYDIDTDFQVNEFLDGINAVGAGREYALGALHTLPTEMDPYQRITSALEAAAYYCAAVLKPFRIMCGEKSDEQSW